MNYENGHLERQLLYLTTPDRRILGALNGVDENSVSVTENANNTWSLSFTVYKTIDGEPSAFYDDVDYLMQITTNNVWYIINEAPKIENDGVKEYKTVNAESCEIELSNYDLQNFLVGQGTESSYEMMYYNEHKDDYPIYQKDSDGNIIFDDNGDPIVSEYFPVIKFYNKENPELSLLHLALYHANIIPTTISKDKDGNEITDWVSNIDKGIWKIGYVDTMPKEYIDYTASSGENLEVKKTAYLPEETYSFDIDNSDLYSFLTQDVSGAFNCIFVFDTENCLINAYYIDHIGKDTNAYIGWRNIQNSLTATDSEDLYTAYTVSGGDGITGIEYANFGSSDIEDFSYFMQNTRYLPQTLIDKYNSWAKFKESKRTDYITAAKNYMTSLDIATEINARVPSDYVNQDWTSKSLEDLMSYYNDYTAMIRGYEKIYVDKDGNFDITELQKSSSWDKYCELLNYTIPTLVNEIAKKNTEGTDLPTELKSYGGGNLLSNAIFMTSSNWNCLEKTLINIEDIDSSPAYGIVRYAKVTSSNSGVSVGIKQNEISTEKNTKYTLSAFVRSQNTGTIKLGYSSSDSDITGDSSAIYTEFSTSTGWERVYITFKTLSSKTEVYFKMDAIEGSTCSFDLCGTMLEIGEAPSSFNYFELDENYLKSCNTNWELYGVEELKIYLEDYSNRIEILADYSGEYSAAETSDSEEIYNKSHQLYLDYKKLYDNCNSALTTRTAEYDKAVSQYESYQSEMLDLKISVQRENFEDPFTSEEENLLKKLYKHVDYTNENIISTDITSTDTTVDKHYMLYLDAVENLYASSHPQYTWEDTIDNVYSLAEYKDLIAPISVYDFVHVEVSDNGIFENLRVISKTYNPCIYAGSFELTFSTITKYKSKRNDFAQLLGNAVSAAKNSITMNSSSTSDTTSYSITPDFIRDLLGSSGFSKYASTIESSVVSTISGNFTNIYSKYIDAEQIVSQIIKADNAEFKKMVAESIDADLITTKILNADKAFFNELSTNIITGNDGSSTMVDFVNDKITTKTAEIKNLLSGTGSFEDLQAIHLTSGNVVIDDAVIQDLIAKKKSVADLSTHSATADEIVLISSEGTPAIGFKNATQQFYDENGNVRVQIGRDGNEKFNFTITGTDGTTAIFDENGITKSGIPDNTIINDMIEESTISKSKLGFPIVETDENGKVSITEILDGNGDSFGVTYTEFQETTKTSIETVDKKVEDSIPYELVLTSSKGRVFNTGINETILSVHLYRNGEDITDNFDEENFIWKRESFDSSGDIYWNEQHSSGTKNLTITKADVLYGASFGCSFTINGETLAST